MTPSNMLGNNSFQTWPIELIFNGFYGLLSQNAQLDHWHAIPRQEIL